MDSDEEALLLLLLLRRRRRRRRQKRKFWVHPILQLREQHGQFHHLFMELRSDEEKFFNYFRMSMSQCPKGRGEGSRRAVDCSSAVNGSSSRCMPRNRSRAVDGTMEFHHAVDGLKRSRLLEQSCVRQRMNDFSLPRGRGFKQSVSTA
ncbi:hypothetical protein WA026_009623 [Henosepilachna vigintioctopunctata]|uniref:Uncharacterized protein n=1 Tax=Henosepilachna vigintioctopunctata TaxID=420089 RepID=A0AAW1U596_9CUCU